MVRDARDVAPVAVDQEATMAEYGRAKSELTDDAKQICAVKELPAVQILNARSEYSVSTGVLPPWLRPLVKLLPWYASGSQAVEDLAGMAVAAVAKRLAFPTDRPDLLSKLQRGKDEEGRPMGREELTAEALAQLVAGSDTTSK